MSNAVEAIPRWDGKAIHPDTLAAIGARPKLAIAGYYSEAMGHVADPEATFAEERRAILQELGDLSEIKVPLNQILVAVWVRPRERKNAGGGSIIIPDVARDEDKWQGVAALVVKLGPHAYEPNPDVQYCDADRCSEGDWVLFRRGDGFRTRVNGRECVLLSNERGIKMVLPRPDMVY